MKTLAARTVYMVVVLVLSSIAVFYAIRLSGGDATAARLPASATYEQREAFKDQLGLNDPIYEQYFNYIGRVFSGDLGTSLTNNAQISDLLLTHGRNSLILGAAAFVLVFAIGIPLGMLASLRRNSWWDGGIMTFSVAGMAVPTSGWRCWRCGCSPRCWDGSRRRAAAAPGSWRFRRWCWPWRGSR